MIIKSFELNKINFQENMFYLFYGENDGHKNEVVKINFTKNNSQSLYRYDEDQILNNKDEFFNSILSKSFFEDNKIIIISRASDKIKPIVNEIINKQIKDIKLLLISNILDKKSKLRSFFEKEKNTICVAFYADTIQTLNSLALKFFKEKKIPISQQTINLLVERSRGNRENLNNELIKINGYLKSKKQITTEEIFQITNLAENYNVSELTDSCLLKNSNKTSKIFNENNYSIEDCILIIRTLLFKSKRLLKLQEEMKNKKNIDQVITNYKPTIFWKDKEVVKQQISNWSLIKIKKLIFKINEIELLIKKNSLSSLNILADFILSESEKTNN